MLDTSVILMQELLLLLLASILPWDKPLLWIALQATTAQPRLASPFPVRREHIH
jgi:hypothetical protein